MCYDSIHEILQHHHGIWSWEFRGKSVNRASRDGSRNRTNYPIIRYHKISLKRKGKRCQFNFPLKKKMKLLRFMGTYFLSWLTDLLSDALFFQIRMYEYRHSYWITFFKETHWRIEQLWARLFFHGLYLNAKMELSISQLYSAGDLCAIETALHVRQCLSPQLCRPQSDLFENTMTTEMWILERALCSPAMVSAREIEIVC